MVVSPVEDGEQVEAITEAMDGLWPEAQQCSGFAAADLGSGGAAQQPVETGVSNCIEQDQPGGNGTAATGAGDGERHRPRGCGLVLAERDWSVIGVFAISCHIASDRSLGAKIGAEKRL